MPIEYDEDTRQWYFIRQDSRSRRWNAINPVPQSYNLGRQSIHLSHTTAAEVTPEDITFRTYGEPDQDSQCTVEQIKTSNILSSMITDNIYCSEMSQTMSALTLARTATTGSHPQFTGFSMKGKGPALPPYVPGGGGGLSRSGLVFSSPIFLSFLSSFVYLPSIPYQLPLRHKLLPLRLISMYITHYWDLYPRMTSL